MFKKSSKVEAIEKSESINDTRVENEKPVESLSLVSSIRRYAPQSIKNLLIGISLCYALEEAKGVVREMTHHQFVSLEDENRYARTVYKDILEPQEYLKFSQYLKLNHVFWLSYEDYQENIHEIAEKFPIAASELIALDDHDVMITIDSLTHEKDLVNALSEIKAAEKENFDASFSIVPIKKIDRLRDPQYVENMKKIVSLGFERVGSNPKIINDTLQRNLQKISNLAPNIRFDGSVLYYDQNKIGINDSFPRIKENLNNSYITNSFLYDVGNYNPKMAKWEVFFSDSKNKALFSILQHEGYGLSSFSSLVYQQGSIDSFFQDEGNLKFFIELAKRVKKSDLNKREVMDLLCYCKDYYAHGKYDSLENILPDIIEVTNKEPGLSIDELITRIGKIGVYKNIYLPLVQETPQEYRLETEFFEDGALRYVRKLGYHKEPPKILAGMSQREQASWIMQTCRAMETMDAECTDSAFHVMLQSIMETRSNPEILDMSLFAHRNVVMMAHNEKYSTADIENKSNGDQMITVVHKVEKDRFAKDSLITAINDQHPNELRLFKASQDLKNLSSQKEGFLNFIKTKKDLTIFIDAHGSPDAVSFSEGLPDDQGQVQGQDELNSVSAREIANALIARFRSGITDKVILIDDACMNFAFIKNVYRYIYYNNEQYQESVPLPIAVGMSEMGQYGFSSFESDYGSMFSENLLKGVANKRVTMGDILEIERDGKGMLSNISVFIPHKVDVERWVVKKKAPQGAHSTIQSGSKVTTNSSSSKKPKFLDDGDFEKKKVKVEIPFQIAENEKNGLEDETGDVPQA